MAHLSTCPPLTRDSVVDAHRLVAPHVHRTPLAACRTLSALASRPRSAADLAGTPWAGRVPAWPRLLLWLKCENAQRVGAFKVRGAFHALLRLMREHGWAEGGGAEKGVVTHSSGNHAQALALAAKELGLPAHVVIPGISAPPKIAATKGYGANVTFSGSTSQEREAVTARVMAETGARLVPPCDHPDIILGQGTMGLELQDQVRELMEESAKADDEEGPAASGNKPRCLDAIMTPCGGGGMLSGVALACEGTGIRVFGAEPSFEGADDAGRGYYAGTRVETVSSLTIADGLRTPLGQHPWDIIHRRRLVAGFYSVSEAEILAAMRLLERAKLFVEPSACVGLAVALFNEDFRAMVEREAGDAGWDLGLVLSGGNVGVEALSAMFAEQPRS